MTAANYCICMCAHDLPLVRRQGEQARLSTVGLLTTACAPSPARRSMHWPPINGWPILRFAYPGLKPAPSPPWDG